MLPVSQKSGLRQWHSLAFFAVLPFFFLHACGSATPSLDGSAATDTGAGDSSRACSAKTTRCSGVCVDLKTDYFNCGGCDQMCKSGEFCSSGKCLLPCQQGLSNCKGTCVDLKTDDTHCGECGNTCKAGEACYSGKCKKACPKGQESCGGTCVSVQTDVSHCGACNNACQTGHTCLIGKCFPKKGLRIWLKADIGVKTGPQNEVTSWADQSGNGFDLVAPASSSITAPTYVAKSTTNRPSVRFVAAQKNLLQTKKAINLLQGTKQITAFMVIKPGATQFAYATIFDYSHANCQNHEIQQEYDSTNKYGGTAPQTLNSHTFQVLTNGYTSGSFFSALDGLNRQDVTACSKIFKEPAFLSMGGNLTLGRYLKADISEMLIYNRALSIPDQVRVEAYLLTKYGL